MWINAEVWIGKEASRTWQFFLAIVLESAGFSLDENCNSSAHYLSS